MEEYQEHLETFFLWLNIVGVMKSQMMETAEAWMLACGEETDHLKVKNRRPCKIDRCFVTCDSDFFELVMAKWDRMSFFTRSLKCGEKMKYMRRLMDIRLDPYSEPAGLNHHRGPLLPCIVTQLIMVPRVLINKRSSC